jgi:hypothetical protein
MKDAGGILMGSGELELIMCIFQNCQAYGSGEGGAIYVTASTDWGENDPAVLNLYAVQVSLINDPNIFSLFALTRLVLFSSKTTSPPTGRGLT